MIVDGSTSTPRSCIIFVRSRYEIPYLAVPPNTYQDDLDREATTPKHEPIVEPTSCRSRLMQQSRSLAHEPTFRPF